MAIRQTKLLANHYYHIYNRGNNRQNIFLEQENYFYFLRKIKLYFSEDVEILSYCLMPNHYHILAYLKNNNFSQIMQKFTIAYTKAINKRFNRVGSLFQGAFKAINISTDEYLLHLSRYIHLNPVKANLVKHPQDWQFSSYLEYIGLRKGNLPKTDKILSYFPNQLEYQNFCESYQSEQDKIIKHLILE